MERTDYIYIRNRKRTRSATDSRRNFMDTTVTCLINCVKQGTLFDADERFVTFVQRSVTNATIYTKCVREISHAKGLDSTKKRMIALVDYSQVNYIISSLWLYSPLDLSRSFSFLILYTVGRTPSTGDQPVARPLPTHTTTQTQNKRIQTSMPRVEFDPTIPVFERAKTINALDRTATVIDGRFYYVAIILYYIIQHYINSHILLLITAHFEPSQFLCCQYSLPGNGFQQYILCCFRIQVLTR
jgi:hypothetical protein